jgi:hypothetical protein
VTRNYKNNLVKNDDPEETSGQRLLLFQEAENPFFLWTRLLRAFPGSAFFLHIICNKREVGIVFLGNGNLLVTVCGLCRFGRFGCFWKTGDGRNVGPWFPIGIGDRESRHKPGRFPLRDNNRCLTLLVCWLHSLTVEPPPAAVTEDRLAVGVGSSAWRAVCIPKDRFLFKRDTATGTEARLVINSRGAAAAAEDRRPGNSCTAPVAELCQLVRYNRAAPGADRESGFFLFRYGSAAPVAELRLVIERCVAAFATGFCHVLHQWIIHIIVDFFGKSL